MTIGCCAVVVMGAFVSAMARPAPPALKRISAFETSLKGRIGAQRHNAQLALSKLNGYEVGPGKTFSFNSVVGTWSRDQGYKKAPISYNGQLISSWGGGVCQTSTTLYNAALLAGMEITERNPHRFAPSYVQPGRDAAVAFSNIDLRFRNPHTFPVKIIGSIENEMLRVEFLSATPLGEKPLIVSELRRVHAPATFVLAGGSTSKYRNTGKSGYETATYRVVGGKRELLSVDSYPVMNRILEFR